MVEESIKIKHTTDLEIRPRFTGTYNQSQVVMDMTKSIELPTNSAGFHRAIGKLLRESIPFVIEEKIELPVMTEFGLFVTPFPNICLEYKELGRDKRVGGKWVTVLCVDVWKMRERLVEEGVDRRYWRGLDKVNTGTVVWTIREAELAWCGCVIQKGLRKCRIDKELEKEAGAQRCGQCGIKIETLYGGELAEEVIRGRDERTVKEMVRKTVTGACSMLMETCWVIKQNQRDRDRGKTLGVVRPSHNQYKHIVRLVKMKRKSRSGKPLAGPRRSPVGHLRAATVKHLEDGREVEVSGCEVCGGPGSTCEYEVRV